MPAWNDWYHINGNTYGTWLRGDPRGWRARHHREHVEGDYKNPPPPGIYDGLHRYSRQLLKRKPTTLSSKACEVACQSMLKSLSHYGVEVIALCVDDHHYHILARFPKALCQKHGSKIKESNSSVSLIRYLVGIAKKNSARALSDADLVDGGGVWAIRFRSLPVRDRSHQVNVFRYIEAHRDRGAAVWTVRM